MDAKLVSIAIERFKSYRKRTQLDVAPLTILLGRNNSGKSTLIQALLLLKQTLEHPRADVPLQLEGSVDALSLRELTHGWPTSDEFDGPVITLTWESLVDLERTGKTARRPNVENLVKHSGIGDWLGSWEWVEDTWLALRTTMSISYSQSHGQIRAQRIELRSEHVNDLHPKQNPSMTARWDPASSAYRVLWQSEAAEHILPEFDHFLPFVRMEKRNVGRRHRDHSRFNGYLILYEQPLEDLRTLLQRFLYLGSMRTIAPSIYRPVSVPPAEIGMSGEYTAQMLHARQSELVHYLPPLAVDADGHLAVPETVVEKPLVDALNHVLGELGVAGSLRLEDIQNIGFRLFFGDASLQHVGRGIGYLLPVVQLGLVADPQGFGKRLGDLPVSTYGKNCETTTHIAIEEPETHLHPKVQTRLAHWLVSLAMAERRLLVETHSDHLVRRLRGLIARAARGSELEKWLRDNIVIAEITQDEATGESSLVCSRLDDKGGIVERWPEDFMDESSREEREIYYAGLDKQGPEESAAYAADTEFIHDPTDG